MKTIICEEPNRFVMKDTEKPVPHEGEALVRIKRIGICGTDLHAYKGNQPYFTYPRILGHEMSGEIIEIGANEMGLSRGDLVIVSPYRYCGTCIACQQGKTNCCTKLQLLGVHEDGGMREYIAVPTSLLIKADGLTPEQAAITECLCIGAHAVRRAGIVPGEYVLVIGAGPIGLGVMKFAKLAGAKVIALDINEERLAYCRQWVPVDETVNAKNNPLQAIEEITQGNMPTVVLDATGNVASMESAPQYVAHTGRLIYVGLVKSKIAFDDPDFHRKEMSILSSRNATLEDFEQVMDSIRRGVIDTDSYITHRVDFDRMIETYDSWLMPDTGVIKAVVNLD
ncbi:alcohol dehydrogenase catalytic domain-containing protein [Paenibacillus sp. LMG 31456]|uniref:Alcohol dehydrogenase catalytic domain-containing protein n=1 Tax=Paenibacillus foliorum TaxID=2654974 RepID=A0A972GT58_9BACL|nr:zinc-binding alcohol dehydrogenase family protein [Paenibacillus foliorum]NOU95878.1 alcohol dehydrogenase catalytic domain-containing protein [Paenibacillus foliorum]